MRGVFLGLGTNKGDRQQFLDSALKLIGEKIGEIVKQSSVVESKPWGNPDQDDFLNMVIEVDTDLKPSELLEECQLIESELGRQRGEKWGPREIDVDILLYGDRVVDSLSLQIPHRHMWDRDFVVGPLKEIAPEVVKKWQ